MDRGQQFPENTTGLDAPTCKHCGAEISTNVSKLRYGKGKGVYLWPQSKNPEWFHTAIADIILNNEGTIRALERDPDWNHTPEPADGRSHEDDYQRHVLETRMRNMANGIDPIAGMQEAMAHPLISRTIAEEGLGTV